MANAPVTYRGNDAYLLCSGDLYKKDGTPIGGGSGAGFDIVQCDAGTDPTSGTSNNPLTLTSSDGKILITGTAGTDTIDFTAPNLISYTGAAPSANYLPRFSDGTGKVLKSSLVSVGNAGELTSPSTVQGATLTSTGALNLATFANLTAQTSDPAAPAAGDGRFFAHRVGPSGGLILPKFRGPADPSRFLQRALWHGAMAVVVPGAAATFQTLGCQVNAGGTGSSAYQVGAGYCENRVTAASANATGYWTSSNPLVTRDGGHFFFSSMYFPDASYADFRSVAGLTDRTTDVCLTSNSPAGSRVMFMIAAGASGLSETNWMISSSSGVETRTDTGMAFAAQKLFHFYIWAAPGGALIHWEIRNITDSTVFSGSIDTATANVPLSSAILRMTHGISTIAGSAINVKFRCLYTENWL